MMSRLSSAVLLFLLMLVACLASGCKTPESADNDASRPWSNQRSWETGLPGFQNEDRR